LRCSTGTAENIDEIAQTQAGVGPIAGTPFEIFGTNIQP
jgi:hypothetical protein